MRIATQPNSVLPTLSELWSGMRCPHEETCACRVGYACPQAKSSSPDSESEFPMLHLAGCSFRNPSCCCRILDEIEAVANQYLEIGNVTAPPVPIDLIRQFDTDRPIEIREVPLKACYGASWFLGDEWVIHLNKNTTPNENRFTTFHEGFHIVCQNSGFRLSHSNDLCKPLGERLADHFAASILMPRSMVISMWPEVHNINEIAMTFRVPKGIASERLKRLVAL